MDLSSLKKINKNASIIVLRICTSIDLITFRGVSKTTIMDGKPQEGDGCVFTIFIVFLLHRVAGVSHRHCRSPLYKAQWENLQPIRELSGFLMIQ